MLADALLIIMHFIQMMVNTYYCCPLLSGVQYVQYVISDTCLSAVFWSPLRSVPSPVPEASFIITPTVVGGQSSLSVQWRPPSSDLPVLGYIVTVKVSSLVGRRGREMTVYSTPLTVENLTIGTNYTISLKARSAVGFGAEVQKMVNTINGEKLV